MTEAGNPGLWAEVDTYIGAQLVRPDASLDATLAANAAAGLPSIDVSPAHGKLLQLFARMIGARRILEIGTLGGYSTIWMARALPLDGVLVTLEVDARHAEVARRNFVQAAVADRIDLRVGAALDTLPQLHAEGGSYDLIFIDADKPNNPNYVTWALRLARPGSVIICDNVVRRGAIVDAAAASRDPNVEGTRRLFDLLSAEGRIDATAIQTVGLKGWDGFAIGLVV